MDPWTHEDIAAEAWPGSTASPGGSPGVRWWPAAPSSPCWPIRTPARAPRNRRAPPGPHRPGSPRPAAPHHQPRPPRRRAPTAATPTARAALATPALNPPVQIPQQSSRQARCPRARRDRTHRPVPGSGDQRHGADHAVRCARRRPGRGAGRDRRHRRGLLPLPRRLRAGGAERGGGSAVPVSPLLFAAIATALRAAAVTGGLRRPHGGRIGAAPWATTATSVPCPPTGRPSRSTWPAAGLAIGAPGPAASTVQIPAGVELDLGATAKALAVDLAADAAGRASGAPVLVSIGGDLAVGGPARPDGWPVLVTHDHAVRRRPRGPDGHHRGRWPGHLGHRRAPLATRPGRGPPPRRSPHRAPGRVLLAHGDGGRRLLRRRQHRHHRRHRDGPRGSGLARGASASRPGWWSRRPRAAGGRLAGRRPSAPRSVGPARGARS